MEHMFIAGPAGELEACISRGTNNRAVGVLCHPHPLYGGTMDDMVVGALEEGLQRAGVDTVRFNFRGVGGSAGTHDGDGGETGDLTAVCDWLAGDGGYDRLVVAGYSFGGGVAAQAALEGTVRPDLLVLVAPALGPTAAEATLACPVLVVTGAEDQFIGRESVEGWLARHAGAGSCEEVAGADHFFGGAYGQVGELAQTAAQAVVP